MKGLFKKIVAVAAAAVSMFTMGLSVYAEVADYELDTSTAKTTRGGGQAFLYFLRNTNEVRKHGKQLDNAWFTPDSEIIVKYEYMGEIPEEKKEKGIDYPASLVLQSWTGDLVDATEDRWIELVPTTYSETEATFTYTDMLAQWPDNDLSALYAMVVVDEGVSLTVNDIVITNLDIPDDAEYVGLTKLNDTDVAVEPEPVVTDTVETDTSETGVSDGESVATEAPEENVTEVTESGAVTTAENGEEGVASSSTMTIIIIVAAAVVIIGVVVVVIVVLNSKKGSKKKGNYYD